MFPPPFAISLPRAGRMRAARQFLTAHSGPILCALFLLAGLALAGDYGGSHDAPDQRQIAVANWDYIRGRADRIAPGNYHDRVYSAVVALPLLLAEQAAGLTDAYHRLRLRQTLLHLIFILGGFFCYRLAHQLFGSRPIALLALLIYLLHPRLYAHSFINFKDLPFLSMFILTLYLLERAFRRDALGAFLLLGMAVGLLTNLRIMGIMLLAAVWAMRGLDWFYAGQGPERKHILRTGGLFTLAAGLTLYALSPYAWTNPIDYLTTNLTLTVNHPTIWPQLFQGEWRLSNALPPHYIPVWFGITTPPLLMLLGLVGAATVAAAALRRPAAVFRNTRRRLQLLLLACFLLPPLAAAAFGSVQYDNWRHLYFVYAPFGLLAALGGGWLAVALARRRPWRLGAYALVGTGLGLILLQMAQIHPLQYDYFNFLVDRTTPEYLRGQYTMDQWGHAHRAGLAYMLKQHPGETLTAYFPQWNGETLPPAARRRLLRAAGGGNADYALRNRSEPSRPDTAFNSLYRRPYNNALTDLRPLTAARMPPSVIAAYDELYRQAVAGEPIIRADYNVYRNGNRLTLVKENCAAQDRDVRSVVKIFPHHPETVPPELLRPRSYATFSNDLIRLESVCLSLIQLPDYAAGDLMLRQSVAGNAAADTALWEELYSLSQPGLRELIAARRAALPLTLNSVEGRGENQRPAAFAVFIDRDNGRNRLLYAKKNCSPAEYAAPVTLHLYPENRADLPFYLWQGGLDNRDFALDAYGGRPGGECIAVVHLPDYPIAALRTGQTGRWEVNLYPTTAPAYLRATYAALAGRAPNARANFDLYLRDNRLIYRRESCAAADTAADFFLHIIPAAVADLPAERRDAGFANRDFAFERRGGHFDGKCIAVVLLPPYPIKTLRTGQYAAGQGELWAAELPARR